MLVGICSFIAFLIAIIIAFQEKLYDLETEQITTLSILKNSNQLKEELQNQMKENDDASADNTHEHKENPNRTSDFEFDEDEEEDEGDDE